MKEYILPTKVILINGEIENSETLLVKKEEQVGLCEKEYTEMIGESYILLDFGKEVCGGVRILICNHDSSPIKIRITFGESVSEALSNIGESNSTNDHAPRDYEITTTNLCDIETGNTGFRFVKITKISKDSILKIKNIYAISNFNVNKDINFESDDNLINQIFSTAARTVNLCVQNGYLWDGIKRDRLVWAGDMYPEFIALKYLHQDISILKNSLMFVKNQTDLPLWMNQIPMYSMWWLITMYEYCYRENDFKMLLDNEKYIYELANQILDNINEKGKTIFEINFFDWPTSNSSDEIIGVHALTIICLKKLIEIYKCLNKDATNIKNKLEAMMLNEFDIKDKKQVKALLSIAKNDFNAETLSFLIQNNSQGFSTFMSYFILCSIFDCGGKRESVELMKEYYGAMLDMGATTFFEDFDVSWCENAYPIDSLPVEGKKDIHGDFGNYCYKGFRHSLCHGWSSGVIAFIVEKIIGIKTLEAGGNKIVIDPYMENIKFIKYRYPIYNGYIDIELKQENGKVYCKWYSSNNVEVTLKNAIKR